MTIDKLSYPPARLRLPGGYSFYSRVKRSSLLTSCCTKSLNSISFLFSVPIDISAWPRKHVMRNMYIGPTVLVVPVAPASTHHHHHHHHYYTPLAKLRFLRSTWSRQVRPCRRLESVLVKCKRPTVNASE